MICGSGGSKSRLAKAAGAESPAQMRMKNCTPLWREAHFQVKMIQNAQNIPGSDHFWKLGCGKWHAAVARKNIFKSTF